MYELKTIIKDTSRCLTKCRECLLWYFFILCLCCFNFPIPLTMQAWASVLPPAYPNISLVFQKKWKNKQTKKSHSNGITATYSQCLSTSVEPAWSLNHWFFLWWTCLKIVSTSICTLSNAVVSLASHNKLCIMCIVLAFIPKSRALWVGEENSIKLIALV